MTKVVVLTGAGMSADSGLKTFRDADGLWAGHDVTQVATPEGWHRDRKVVLEFYNERRRKLLKAEPNPGHRALVRLEKRYDVVIITQNIDDLHERAGSTNILHLHGELLKARSSADPRLVYECRGDIALGDRCERGSQLRPHVVWFGEPVPAMEEAVAEISDAAIVMIIGTSLQVYPAAGLIHYAPRQAQVFYIDPRPNVNPELAAKRQVEVIAENARTGVPEVVDKLLKPEKPG